MSDSYRQTGLKFDEVFEYITLISQAAGENKNGFTIGSRLAAIIDGRMEDLGDLYMSNDVISRVECYLVDKELMY